MKKQAKQVVAKLEEHGYHFSHCNAKAFHVYVTDDGRPDLPVNTGMDERQARSIIRRVERDVGIERDVVKRNPTQIKERQAAERERAAADLAKLDQERADILAQRDKHLDGLGARLTRSQVRAIEKRINQIDRDRKRLTALMTQTPTSGGHGGLRHAQHQTGRNS